MPAKLQRRFRRHRCPADVEIIVKIGGQQVIGAITGEELAYIAKYAGGYTGYTDVLEGTIVSTGPMVPVNFYIKYLPPRRRRH